MKGTTLKLLHVNPGLVQQGVSNHSAAGPQLRGGTVGQHISRDNSTFNSCFY